ncbi:hypothetical protein CONPUDRAFT_78774 [Coniophora puteana RWD-64-598 SS2]|uniref:Uncharacterized protein n=1 Tax=Coniophora puteana (strain RWD-64-598) TaxID=741705 RepID=A0A5M3N537_CONPW|nr:uncharacterized protein CONPUDRAFT_78774 [Coniophora puteana RWD-64-598 SS2]EIW86418.1 hypothetical protein CONPUDRAFT_78774 [Coniophora puteana RWD-64-598 SS2]
MAALTMSSLSAQSSKGLPRPYVSSPLASSSQPRAPLPRTQRGLPARGPAFPSSQPLRPFASISYISKPGTSAGKGKQVKLIEPPKNFKSTFVLDLSQEEFSRQM